MNENQIRPETEGVCKFAMACHEKKKKQKQKWVTVCISETLRINYFAAHKHIPVTKCETEETRTLLSILCTHC